MQTGDVSRTGSLGHSAAPFEIVEGVDHQRAALQQIRSVDGRQLELVGAIAGRDRAIEQVGQHARLGRSDILLGPRLSRQIVLLYSIAIDQNEITKAHTRQAFGQVGAEGTATAHCNLLPLSESKIAIVLFM